MRTMGRKWICLSLLLLIGVIATLFAQSVAVNPKSINYADALSKSILYFEAQRSGLLPSSQRAVWRGNSGLHDGKTEGLDLTGGYYDAGDNVKFGLPMAFTSTMLAWSVVEYGPQLQSRGELSHALDAIKWATDYFIKAHPEPNVFYGEVGDGASDHLCWMRPEDMTTSRAAYRIDPGTPGSDLAGETAAALAAASIVFARSNPSYSTTLLTHAKQLFSFADTYRGKYDNSIMVARNFYASRSGYADELLWAAIWLYKATGQESYLKYVADNAVSLGGTGWGMKEFSWDVKYAGVQILASKVLLDGKAGPYVDTLKQYQQKAEYFICAQLQGNTGTDNTDRTPGGLLYVRQWNNMQYVTASSFILAVYSDYLGASGQLQCHSSAFSSSALLSLAKSQVDYILGHNPRSTSYMVGFGSSYPKQVHHRAASIVSHNLDSRLVECKEGYSNWYGRKQDDPNVIFGAIVGGPDENDNFADERSNYEQTEPATYNNGPLVGLLAKLAGGSYPIPESSDTDIKTPVAKPYKPVPPNPKPTVPTPKPKPPTPKPKPPTPKPKPRPTLPVKDVPLVITQKLDGTWSSNGKTWSRYKVTVTNKSKFVVTDLVLRIKGYSAIGEMWGLIKIGKGHNWILPDWLKSVSPGQSFDFVYFQPAPPATVVVRKYQVAA